MIQRFKKLHDMREAVTKGCRVNLRNKEGRLMSKGWKIMTTNHRMSERMAMPRTCDRSYKHGLCEGSETSRSALYTKEYAKRATTVLLQELSFHAVQEECAGRSQLGSMFGRGEFCTCGELRNHGVAQTCGSCMLGRHHLPENPEMSAEIFTTEVLVPRGSEGCVQGASGRVVPQTGGVIEAKESQVEGLARVCLEQKKFQDSDCEQLLELLWQTVTPDSSGVVLEIPHVAATASRASYLSRYMREVLQDRAPAGAQWSRLHIRQRPQSRTTQEDVVFQLTVGQFLCQAQLESSCQDLGPQTPYQHRCSDPDPDTTSGEMACVGWRDGEGVQGVGGVTRQERERIMRQLYLLHAATGHGNTKHMIDALKRRGAKSVVLQLAREFRCSVCAERQRVGSRHLASLEPLPPKWHTLAADVGHFQHPRTNEHVQFLMLIDEGSRFRAARVLTRGSRQQPSAAACLQYMREGWTQYFGHPKTLRLDPAGSFRSQTVEAYCDQHGIFLDIIPGEAHWKIGVCEQAIKGTKEVMLKLCEDDPELTCDEALSAAVQTFNQRDVIRGFSPMQHALGRTPDDSGRIVQTLQEFPPELLVENASGEFARTVERRASAERAHVDWQAQQRLSRARNSRTRPAYDFEPGELVYFWRTQEAGKTKRFTGTRQGRFLGPARILATEQRREADGTLRPGSDVWLVRGRSLLKCVPEQLRRASPREELIESLSEDLQAPWTFTKVAEEIGGNQFEDLTQERPDPEEWERAQDPERENQPTRYRLTRKRPGPPLMPESESIAIEEDGVVSTSSSSNRRPRPPENVSMTGEKWWQTVPESAWLAEASCYWADEGAAVEVSIELPSSQKKLQKSIDNLAGFFVSAMKRRAIEVNERRLSPEDLQKFREAKDVEVRNFLAAEAFEALPPHLQPSRDQAIGMRWVLTWKARDDGSTKAKARAVLLGYQDPAYEHRATTAPVMSRQTRQLQVQLAAIRDWDIQKGDVSGAFLQGREYPDRLYCIPCPEICQAMQIPNGSVTRLRRACYGLVDAPLEWYRTVAQCLQDLGLERSWSDACCWVWRKGGQVRGMISGHVDDFLFSGKADDTEWQGILTSLRERFKWGDWDTNDFVQCGVRIRKVAEGFELSQPRYLEDLREIPVSSGRRKDKGTDTTDREKSQLRTLLGGLSWHAQQVAPHLSAEVSLLLSEVNTSQVDTLMRANKLLFQARTKRDHVMRVHRFSEQEPLAMYAWVDAANQNRWDGSSTQGIFIGLGPASLLQGEVGSITPVSWHSTKVDRVCRSPGAAEVQAAVNGEDTLYYARFQWAEILYGQVDVRDNDLTTSKVIGCLITDSRNVFDKVNVEVVTVKGAERKSNLELLAVKDSQLRTQLKVRWVHSEAQLANGLTKAGCNRELELYYQMGHRWRIVEDAHMRSARKRRAEGLEPLANTSNGIANKDD